MQSSGIWKKASLTWLDDACVFTSTLVDRIVTGYPRDDAEELWKEFGYQDNIVVTAEPFWSVGNRELKDISKELPLPEQDFLLSFTDNQKPYGGRERYVS